MSQPHNMGSITTMDPVYDDATKILTQSMTVQAGGRKIDGAAIGVALTHAAKLFEGTLLMNGLTDYKWPPERADAAPSDDFRAAVITFATRATKPSGIISLNS